MSTFKLGHRGYEYIFHPMVSNAFQTCSPLENFRIGGSPANWLRISAISSKICGNA